MNTLGRLAALCGLLALVGCGPEAPVAETSEETVTSMAGGSVPPPICPEVMPPLCEDGDLYPLYSGTCLIGFECVPRVAANANCPHIVYPGPGFCEHGTITPVYSGGCLVRYTCSM